MQVLFALLLFAATPGDRLPPAAARLADLLRPSLPAGVTLTALVPEPPLPAACAPTRAQPTRPLEASGRIALRLRGRGCPTWTWAAVEIARAGAATTAEPAAGTAVRVVVRVGDLTITELGRLIPCQRDVACAVVPSGKHVEGRLDGETLLVEVP
jgi:hypothetical protein